MSNNGADDVVDLLDRLSIPVTRESFIELNWLGNPPDPWTAEDEMQLPIYMQSSADAGFDDDLGVDAWTEADHPRGQPGNAGEFGPGGGKGAEKNGTGGEKAEGGESQHGTGEAHTASEHPSRLETGAPLPHEVVARIASAAKAAAAIPPTHTINTPERAALRTRIADDLYSRDIAKRVRGHEATIILGLPGAGKSTFASPLLNAGALEIDPDLAKEKLPEFNHGLGAMATHEESSGITREVLKRALASGDNIVWPRINSPEKILKDIQSLKKANYKVHVRFVDVPHEVAMQSVVKRFLDTGRYVPTSTISAFGDKAAKAYDIARKSGLVDSAERHRRTDDSGFTKVNDND